MVFVQTDTAGADCATFWLRPERRLSRRKLWIWAALLGMSAILVAWLSARRGNVIAPLFALLETAGLCAAFAAVWRGGQRGERIVLDAHELEVTAWPGRRRASFPSGWVRVRLEPGAGRQRLVLRSHGREAEIGAFLAEDERAQLAQELRSRLADAAGRAP